MSIFSERLTNARELKHWTRKRAVAEFGIPYQTYSNYENGKREPDLADMLDNAHSYDGKPMDDHDRALVEQFLVALFSQRDKK